MCFIHLSFTFTIHFLPITWPNHVLTNPSKSWQSNWNRGPLFEGNQIKPNSSSRTNWNTVLRSPSHQTLVSHLVPHFNSWQPHVIMKNHLFHLLQYLNPPHHLLHKLSSKYICSTTYLSQTNLNITHKTST